MSSYRQLAPAAYLVAALLFIIPFYDALSSIAPWHFEMAQWRFAAVGLMSNAFMLPAAGLLIAATAALTFSQYKTQLWIGLLGWFMMLMMIIAMLAFSLDAVQTKNTIKPEQYLAFRAASVLAEIKLLLAAIAFALIGRSQKVERWFKRWLDAWLKKRTAVRA